MDFKLPSNLLGLIESSTQLPNMFTQSPPIRLMTYSIFVTLLGSFVTCLLTQLEAGAKLLLFV